jgi:hypothetical protein
MALDELNEGLKGQTRFPGWSFEQHGPVIEGRVVGGGRFQGTVYRSNPPVPDTWPDGSPKYTYYVTLDNGLIDPQTPGHDGKWNVTLSSNRWTAVQDALKAAGRVQQGVEEGGVLGLAFVGERPTRDGTAKYKAFEARYTPPAVLPGSAFGNAAPAAAQPAPAAPPQAPPPAPAPQVQFNQPQPAPGVAWAPPPAAQPPQAAPVAPQPAPAPAPAQAPPQAPWATPAPAAAPEPNQAPPPAPWPTQ